MKESKDTRISEKKSPFKCHVFVCVNFRGDNRKSCAGGNSKEIRSNLKDKVKNKGWEKDVRVSQSLCMGLCANGPNVVIYPQQILFTEVSVNDVDQIIFRIETLLDAN